MGWGRWLLLGDLGQQLDLSDQRQEMERLRAELQGRRLSSVSTGARMERLQAEIEELKLYVAALARLIVRKQVATLDDLKSIVAAIDSEDGSVDGRHSGSVLPKS